MTTLHRQRFQQTYSQIVSFVNIPLSFNFHFVVQGFKECLKGCFLDAQAIMEHSTAWGQNIRQNHRHGGSLIASRNAL